MVSAEGDELGDFQDIITNVETGRLVDLVVEPDMKLDTAEYEEEGGFILVPFDAVKAIKEVIVVDGAKVDRRRAQGQEA